MTISLTHSFVSAIAEDPLDSTNGVVGPTEWNAQHTLTQATGKLLGRTTAGAGATEEITPDATLSLSGGALGVVNGNLTSVSDTNVTITLGGTPTGAVLKATSITLGWTGTLAAARLNSNVVQGVTNDTNVTGSISAQALTLGWTGTLAAGRLNANVVQGVTNDTNITGSISAQNLTFSWAGTLSVARGGTGGGAASGTLLDNITGFSSTGFLSRTGAGTYSFTASTGSGSVVLATSPAISTPAITGGTIDNSTIGGTTPAAGTFTTLNHKAGNSSTNVRATGQITAQLSSTGTGADTTEDTLQTFTLPANALDAVGRGVRIAAWGTTGADGNNKTVRLYFGVAIYNSTAVTTNNGSWYLWAEVRKTGSNTQTSVVTGVFTNSIPITAVNTPNQTDTAGIVIKVTGQNGTAVANDIVCSGMTVEMIN